MRLFTFLGATLAAFVFATTASAALNVEISSADDLGALVIGQTFTVDITISTTAPEALGLGLRAKGYGPELSADAFTTLPSIFNFSPSVPFGGIANQTAGVINDGIGPGPSVNLFQGVSLSAAAGTGPEVFSVTFTALAQGSGVIEAGAFEAFADTYVGGDNVINNASIAYTVVPEPGTALLMGLGLAGLAAAGRRE